MLNTLKNSKIIAIGPREQDFEYTNDFIYGSITLFGSGTGGNISYCSWKGERINHNIPSQEQDDFITKEMIKKINQDPDIRFLFYDPNRAYNNTPDIISRTICLNDRGIMNKLNHKISFRRWAQNICPIHHSDLILGSRCNFESLVSFYGNHKTFIVQADFACGGEGTFLLTQENDRDIQNLISLNEEYLVSPYIEKNIPVNIHAIIYGQDIVLFPISIQIMESNGCKLLYRGADFIAIKTVNQKAISKFQSYTLDLCKEIQKEGYRGIIGVDGMLIEEEASIVEVNNRFQGSTPLLNLALHEAKLPSIQEINYESFNNDHPSTNLLLNDIPYSCYTYIADKNGRVTPGHGRLYHKDPNIINIKSDGLNYKQPITPFSSLERIIFNTNIVSITEENDVRIHPNIPDTDTEWIDKIINEGSLLHTKIALINQGVYLPKETIQYLDTHGGMRDGVYNAIDISFNNIVINSAIHVKFAAISPFSLRVEKGSLVLFYCNTEISKVEVSPADTIQDIQISDKVKVKDICLLATDRVRVQHSPNCYFVQHGIGCKFCEVENCNLTFTKEDIFKSIDQYLKSQQSFRHFLIGGKSSSPKDEPERILEIVQYIHSHGDWPIYVMCTPPKDLNTLNIWKEAGVTEIGLNIEIWDKGIARKWMQGKGAIQREYYIKALQYATAFWGKAGAVRSAFVVGLEPEESLLKGIEEVCKVGAAPILSVFRPIPGTVGEAIVPLNNNQLLSIYKKAESICSKYNLRLGPSCIMCQNNTLSMPE